MELVLTLISLLVSLVGSTPPADEVPEKVYIESAVYADVSYGDFERNTMDIYLPQKTSQDQTFGALLFIHGGSWTSGDKATEAYLCNEYMSKGYVTASINYHYIDEHTPVSTNMDDIASAIETLDAFCSEKGYDVTGLALHGYSSGAHLATLFSYSCPERSIIPIKFVVNMAGPSDFNSATWEEWDYDKNTGPGLALLLYGTENIEGDLYTLPAEKYQEIINAVSPVYYINENSVPTICGYAGDGKDGIVPTKNKTVIFEKLAQENVKNSCFTFENSNHFLLGDPIIRKALYGKVDEYCKTYFGY